MTGQIVTVTGQIVIYPDRFLSSQLVASLSHFMMFTSEVVLVSTLVVMRHGGLLWLSLLASCKDDENLLNGRNTAPYSQIIEKRQEFDEFLEDVWHALQISPDAMQQIIRAVMRVFKQISSVNYC